MVIIALLSIYMLLYIFKRLHKYLLIKPHKTPESQIRLLFINRKTEPETKQLFPKPRVLDYYFKNGNGDVWTITFRVIKGQLKIFKEPNGTNSHALRIHLLQKKNKKKISGVPGKT